MKNFGKRIVALVLTLCMTLSVLPPMVFAAEGEQNPGQNPVALDQIVYDFDLRSQEYSYSGGTATLAGKNIYTPGVELSEAGKSHVASLYQAGTTNWNYHSVGNTTAQAEDFGFSFGAADVNYYLLLRTGPSNPQVAGGYFAVTVKSPGTANYKLTLDYFTHSTGASQGSVYVLPGDTPDVAAAIAGGNAVGTFSCEGTYTNGKILGEGSKTFDSVLPMEADKEYLLVFTADALNSQNDKRAALYLGNVTLDKVVDAPKEITYDFDLRSQEYSYSGGTATLAGKNIYTPDVELSEAGKSHVASLYQAGTTNWNYHSVGNTTAQAEDFGFSFGAADVNYYLLLRTGPSNPQVAGGYFAVTVRSPGAGTYKLSLDYFTHSTGAAQGSVYVLPGNTTDIAQSLKTATAVGTFSCEGTYTNGKILGTANKTFENEVHLDESEECLLVFTTDALNSQNDKRAALYLGNAKLTEQVAGTPDESTPDESTPDESTPDESTPEETLPALQVDQIVYDFGMGVNGDTYGDNVAFGGKDLANNSGSRSAVADLYTAGTLNWKYHSTGNTTGGTSTSQIFKFGASNVNYKLNLYTSGYLPNAYFAATIRSPGTGDYKLTLDYFTHSSGASRGSVYVLPGNTTDITESLKTAAAVGTFSCEGDFTSGTVLGEGTVTFDKAVPMETGKEYLLVFTSDAASTQRTDRATLYLGNVTLTKEGTNVPGGDPDPAPSVPAIQVDQLIYDFDLRNQTYEYAEGDNRPFAGINLTGTNSAPTIIKKQMEELYNAGTTYWKYHSVGNTTGSAEAFGFNFGPANANYALNLRAGASSAQVPGGFFAMTVLSPGTGNYKLTVNYATHATGASKVSAYLLPGDTSNIAAAIAAGTAAVTFSCEDAAVTSGTNMGNGCVTSENFLALESGKEYLLVFTSDKACVGRENRASLYLNNAIVTKEGTQAPTEPSVPDNSADPLPPVQRDQIVYEFGLNDMGLTYGENVNFDNRNLTSSSAGRNAVAEFYANGTLNWKFHSKMDGIEKPYFNFGNTEQFYNLLMYAKTAAGDVVGDYFYATTIRSPGTGNYKLTADYYVSPNGSKQGSIYILPNNTSNIAAAIENGEAVGVIKFDNGKTTEAAARVTFDKLIPMELGKEYLMVFVSDGEGRVNAAMHYDRITLTKDGIATPENITPELEKELEQKEIVTQRDKIVYDFDLGHNDQLQYMGHTFSEENLRTNAVQSTVKNYYKSGYLDWKYHSSDMGAAAYVIFGGVGLTREFKWPGVCMYSRDPETNVINSDYYYAYIIRSPGTGNYKLTLDYLTHTNGAKQGSLYILPADTTDIRAAIEASKAIGTTNYDNGATNSSLAATPGRTTFGKAISMEAGKEYMLVFTSDISGRAHSALYVDSVTLTKEGIATPADIIPYRAPEPKPIPAGSTVYNLDYADPLKKVDLGSLYIKDVLDKLDSRYNSGISNWTWETQDVGSLATIRWLSYGLATYSNESEWIALKIKSPGKGLYTVGANHANATYSGTVAAYILPADTEDIGEALDLSNRVGKAVFTNYADTARTEDGGQSFFGTWEFEEGEEYLLVLQAYKKSMYHSARSYMILSQVFMTPGDIMDKAAVSTEKVIKPMLLDAGPVKALDPTYYHVTTQVNGCDYLFMPCEGKMMLVFDLDNGLLVDEVPTGLARTYGAEVDPDGNIWMAGENGYIFRYDPVAQVGKTVFDGDQLNPDCDDVYSLEYADGYMYFGMYPAGTIGRYELSTGEVEEIGPFHPDTTYIGHIEYKDGYLYIGITGDKNSDGTPVNQVIKLDAKTSEIVGRCDISHLVDEKHKIFNGMSFAGDILLCGSTSVQRNLIAIDTNTMEWVDFGIKTNISWEISDELDGKVYFLLSGMGLHSMDVQTHEIQLVPGFKDATKPLRCRTNCFVEVDDPLYPGVNIATVNVNNGEPMLYNLETGKTKAYSGLFADDYGNGVSINCMENGMPGSNMLYLGAFNTLECAGYNTETGEFTKFEAVSAQTDSIVVYKDVLYTGNYNAGCITRINMEDPARNQVLLTLGGEDYNQVRPHRLIAGDDKLFVGTTPYTHMYGGAFAMIDLVTLERTVYPNIIEEQSIHDLVYHDGLVYGASSIHGGSGTSLREDLSAKIFVYDVEKKEKLGEYDLRDYISGIEGNIDYISGIAADPNVDENGKIWGHFSETLFSFSYDKDTGKFSVKEELSFEKNNYPSGAEASFYRPILFDGNGNMYVAFFSQSGFRRINVNNPSDNERAMPLTPNHYTLGEDGNIYYTYGAELHMYPLNVTEEDWKIAEEVDQMILAIGDDITLDSEEAIVAARTAYEALNVKYKALIQQLETLEEAEASLLVLKIDALPETITLEEQELIESLVAQYKAMTKQQKQYVKNYSALKEAQKELNILIDKKLAAEVQAMIDTIKDLGQITLEHKDRIAEIRAAYNALYNYQKIYVDATDLLAAEEVLAALRAAEIERLKQLIASIGEVTLEDEPVIVEADSIFSWLTLEEREQVDGATLSSARIKLTKLQKEAAGKVDVLIGKIGKVGLFSGISISKARKAYNALTEGSKAYVSLIDTLLAAEKAFKPFAITLWCVGGVVVAGGGAATVVVLKKKRKTVKLSEPETETAE